MPPALDRLLASPSALRLLRSIVNASEFPSAFLNSARCNRCIAPRCNYSSRTTHLPDPRWKHEQKTHFVEQETNLGHHYSNHSLDRWGHEKPKNGTEASETAVWTQKLQTQQRLHSNTGIRHVWHNLNGFDLPTEDTLDAKVLWGTFVKVPDLVGPVIDHAADLHKRTGRVYPHLYELCVGYWLPQKRHMNEALQYHHELQQRLKLERLPLRQVVRSGKLRFTPNTFDAFMEIYRNSDETDVYDEVIPALCARGSTALARRWHLLCISRGDFPSPSVATNPQIQALSDESEGPITLGAHMRHGKLKLDQDLLRRLRGRDTAPVRFEDSFCARMFATRAFPPGSIIKGLAMVGVNEIGPQAVRAMASRTESVDELPSLFNELEEAGIALQGCVFSLALETFTKNEQWDLIRGMLDSDQHHDVYDDAKLQKELLKYYMQQQDWKSVHRTLAVLSLFHNDAGTEAWNLLLQAHIRHFEPALMLQVLQSMREKNVLVTAQSRNRMKDWLRPRKSGKNPNHSIHSEFDDVRFVTRAFITILEGGIGHIPPDEWKEIIRRYGMVGRLRELRRLLLWLLSWYAPRNGTRFESLPKSEFLDTATAKLRTIYPESPLYQHYYFHFSSQTSPQATDHPLRQLFPKSFQQALISWGFSAGLLPHAPLEQSMLPDIAAKKHYRARFLRRGILRRLNWSFGLETLVQLRELGVQVHRRTVITTLQRMFMNLFGPGRSKRKGNRIMEDVNIIPLTEYVREVNKIWGSPLFTEPKGNSGYPEPVRLRPSHFDGGDESFEGDAIDSQDENLAQEPSSMSSTSARVVHTHMANHLPSSISFESSGAFCDDCGEDYRRGLARCGRDESWSLFNGNAKS